MSERTDKKSELLKSNLQDSSRVYDLEQVTNNQNDVLSFLLNQSVDYNENPITDSTDWNNLESNSAYMVQSFKGRNAPDASKFSDNNGLVLVVGTYQSVFTDHELAFRTVNSPWGYLDMPSSGVPQSVKNYISNTITPQITSNVSKLQSLADDANTDHTSLAADATSLSNELNSIDVNSDAISSASSFIAKNGASIQNINTFANSNKANISSLANVNSQLNTDISSAANSLNAQKANKADVDTKFGSEDSNVSGIKAEADTTANVLKHLTFGDIKG